MITPLTLQPLADVGVVAVIRAPDASSALSGVGALIAGGVTGIEITYSTPDAAAVIAELAARYSGHILVGAGTVLTPSQAAEAADAGAAFLVAPGSDDDLARAMLATGRTVLLGAMTPTEVMHVVQLGTHAVKLFPASLGGTAFLRAIRAPFPSVPFVPTGGVTAANVGEWFSAGAVAVGAGGDLCSTADLAAGRWDELTSKAAQYRDAVSRWREQ